MKRLNLRDEEVKELLNELEDLGYDETILKGEVASYKKRNTFYTCERTYKKDGKTYKAIWSCASHYDGKCAFNEVEDIEEFYEMED